MSVAMVLTLHHLYKVIVADTPSVNENELVYMDTARTTDSFFLYSVKRDLFLDPPRELFVRQRVIIIRRTDPWGGGAVH